MDNITTVVFDIGRVLTNVDPSGEKFGALMRAINVEPENAFNNFWCEPAVCKHMTGEIDSRRFYEMVCERFDISYGFDEFAEAWCDLFIPIAEMEQLFAEVAERYRVGLLSDTDPLHWDKLKIIMPWLAKIENPTLSFKVGCLKPHPEMFTAAAANCATEKENCLFIDDLIANVDGARYFGMPAMLFTNAKKLRKDLAGLGIL